MSLERRWLGASQVFTQNGTANGQIEVSDIYGFYVKQQVTLRSSSQPAQALEIKRIDGITFIHVGPIGGDINARSDISTFLVADGAEIVAYEQIKTRLKPDDRDAATHESEPINAKRVIPVDPYGTPYGPNNPIPVDATILLPPVQVDIDALTPPTRPDPDSILIVGSEDGLKTGVKRAFVNNLFLQILATEDCVKHRTYDDPGTKNQRVSQIDYTSLHFPGITARTVIVYDDPGTKNQRAVDTIRSIV